MAKSGVTRMKNQHLCTLRKKHSTNARRTKTGMEIQKAQLNDSWVIDEVETLLSGHVIAHQA